MCASDVHFDVPQALLVDVLRWSSGSKSKRIRFSWIASSAKFRARLATPHTPSLSVGVVVNTGVAVLICVSNVHTARVVFGVRC